jgi:hypothetical protein
MADVNQVTVNERAWEQLEAEPQQTGMLTFSGESFLSYPDLAHWRVHHTACDPALNANTYAVEVHRCRSWADFVIWTAHLMGKAWLQHTDWGELLQEAGESAGTRISPAVPPTLHR